MRTARPILLALAASTTFAHCACGGDKTNAPEDVRALFERLFAKLPAAKVDRPLDAIPAAMSLIATSADPEAYRAWAASQPFVKTMMQTPLYQDLRLSRA